MTKTNFANNLFDILEIPCSSSWQPCTFKKINKSNSLFISAEIELPLHESATIFCEQKCAADNQKRQKILFSKNCSPFGQHRLIEFIRSKNIIVLSAIVMLLISSINADCGCGARCEKYFDDQHCTRCCTTAVRRSVSFADYPLETRGETFEDKFDVSQSLSPKSNDDFTIPSIKARSRLALFNSRLTSLNGKFGGQNEDLKKNSAIARHFKSYNRNQLSNNSNNNRHSMNMMRIQRLQQKKQYKQRPSFSL